MSVDPVTIGAKVALTAASYLMAPKMEGPRLKTLEVSTGAYGTPYPEVDGYSRIDGCICAFAEKLREKKVESKTKGGKYTQYKYFFTGFYVAAGHEIDAIVKIRMNNHLVYDQTKAGPISPMFGFITGLGSSPVKLTKGKNLRIYLGTETQLVDPRYAAWCEDRYGPDSATARRGTAGIFLEEIPLEKLGNAPPQVSMDVVNNPTPSLLYEQMASVGVGPIFSKDRLRALFHDTETGDYQIWDVPTRAKIIESTWGGATDVAYAESGSIWGIGGFPFSHEVSIFAPDGNSQTTPHDLGVNVDYVFVINNTGYFRPQLSLASTFIISDGINTSVLPADFVPNFYFADLDSNAWALGMDGSDIYLRNMATGDQTILAAPGGATGYHSGFFNSDGNIFLLVETTAMVIDIASMTILDSDTITGNAVNLWHVMRQMTPGSTSFFTTTQEIDANDLSVIRSYTVTSWVAGNVSIHYYEPITHSLWGLGTSGVTIRYLDRYSDGGTTLGSIVSAKCQRRGIPTDAIDVSELTQEVIGYYTIQGTGVSQIEPLLEIHDVDARRHDFGIHFKVKGSAADEVIDEGDFVSDEGQRYDLRLIPDDRLPARVEFNYADQTADQQPNVAADTMALDAIASQHKKVFDLTTYADEPDEAQPKVERYLRRQWFERETGEAKLSIKWMKLEPGDVKAIEVNNDQRVVRFTEVNRSGLSLEVKWVRDDPRVHDQSSSAGPTLDGYDEEEIYITAPTKAQMFDIPFLNDSEDDDRPLLHYAASYYGSGSWPGAVFWQGDFGVGEYEQWNAVDSADKAVWGYCEDELGDANPWLWDRSNSIVVQVKSGSLTSVTEAEIDADPSLNQALIGQRGRWEIVNFTTATHLGSGRYTVSGFKRGRRGTEWAVPLHAVGDEFWLAEDAKLDSYGLSNIGLVENFKGQTVGRDPSGAEELAVTLSGASLKPYAPANLRAERNLVTGDWTIRGRRRTRVGGAWVGGTPIPLSEASEDYEIVILNGGGNEVRQLTVTIDGDGNFSATYSASNQATDFGSAQSVISVAAYQLSDAVGRGFAATLTATESGDILPTTITAGAAVSAANAGVTPANPGHESGDTLLCVVICYGGAISASCATTGWTAADGITNPVTMNVSRMWIFQNECDSDSELDPVITVSGGSSPDTVMAVVLRIPRRDTAANFVLGTVSANAANNSTIAFAQNSPSIDNGNAVIAIGSKNRNPISGSSPGNIAGVAAGLDWTKLVAFKTSAGAGMTFSIDYAINDSGGAYTAGTAATVTATYTVIETSAGVYLEAPLL